MLNSLEIGGYKKRHSEHEILGFTHESARPAVPTILLVDESFMPQLLHVHSQQQQVSRGRKLPYTRGCSVLCPQLPGPRISVVTTNR